MHHFFFHFSCKGTLIEDTRGRECADLATAHHHALHLIHRMVALDDVDWRGWSIKVTDTNDRSILNVLFPQVSYCPTASAKRGRDGS